jgi:hypothetical protein
MKIKEMQPATRAEYLTKQLLKLYDYFNNNVALGENIMRQVEALEEDLETYTNLTTDQFEQALRNGRKESTEAFKPSIRLIVQWVSNYVVRFNKSEQKITHSGTTLTRNYPIEQRKAWIISSYRQYHEEKKDMTKFYDFGAPTYEAIYTYCGYNLTHDQREWCFEMSKRLSLSQMFNAFLSRDESDEFRNNATACAYACKLFFDQFPTESDLRTQLGYFDNVSKDHFVASYEKTPSLVAYMRKKNENNFGLS